MTDPSTWIVSAAGIGPISRGTNYEILLEQLPGLVDTTENCPNPRARFAEYRNLSLAFLLTETGAVSGVLVGSATADPSAGPRTLEQIGFGSTEAEVVKALPNAERSFGSADPDLGYLQYTVKDDADGGWITFSTPLPNRTVSGIGVWLAMNDPTEFCG